MRNKILFLLLPLFLACGGGGGGGTTVVTPPLPQQDPTGVWSGVVHSNIANADYSASSVIGETGTFFYKASNGFSVSALISVQSDKGSGTGTIYSGITALPNGSLSAPITITISQVTTKGSAHGTYSGGGDQGTFTFNYNLNFSETPVNMTSRAGTYYARRDISSFGSSYPVLKADGTFRYSDTDWFSTELTLVSGKFTPLTSRAGVLKVDAILANDGGGGGYSFTGLAYATGSGFSLFLTNGSSVWMGTMSKQ